MYFIEHVQLSTIGGLHPLSWNSASFLTVVLAALRSGSASVPVHSGEETHLGKSAGNLEGAWRAVRTTL